MNIPKEIIKKLESELINMNYGKVFLGVVRRGNHCHFEIKKEYTIMSENEDNKKAIKENYND